MKKLHTNSALSACFFSIGLIFTGPLAAIAATTPSLGAAATYTVLGSTYTNTSAGTVIAGDIGFTTGPAVTPGGVHMNYGSEAPYASAGVAQGGALVALASQSCTFTFAPGAINLSTDTTHGAAGTYAPGVYCSVGAMDVSGPLSLSGSGTFIFRPDGALTSTAGAIVTLAGASACDVFWTPTQATTLAANTTFVGTVISDAGITVGANTTWTGRSLAFGGTVTTDTTNITSPSCVLPPPPPPQLPTPPPALATLHVITLVVNATGGTATAANFTLHVKNSELDVSGSPAVGVVSPGTLYSLPAGTYAVSENVNTSFTQVISGDCDATGNVTLASGANKTCIVTSTGIPLAKALPPPLTPSIAVAGPTPTTPSHLAPSIAVVGFTPTTTPSHANPMVGVALTSTTSPLSIAVESIPNLTDTPNGSSAPITPFVTPKFPNTGVLSQDTSVSLGVLTGMLGVILISILVLLRRRTI